MPPAQSIDLPLAPQTVDFFFTTDGRVIALPRKRLATSVRNYLLKGMTVAGFVAAAAACGALLP